MSKLIILLIFQLWTIDVINSQDFEFKWQIIPPSNGPYRVIINRLNSKRDICIIEKNKQDSVIKKISKKDCNNLVTFIKKYDFPNNDIVIPRRVIREYQDCKILEDTNWIVFKKDTIRRELSWISGYEYDKDSNKCFSEWIHKSFTTCDGSTYTGKYKTSTVNRDFYLYCSRISKKDYELNEMIYRLIIKYDKRKNYSILKRFIESDKPN